MSKRKTSKNTKKVDKLNVKIQSNRRVSRKTKRKEAKLIKKARREKNCRKLVFIEPTSEDEVKPIYQRRFLEDDDANKKERNEKKAKKREENEKSHQFENMKKQLMEENEREDRNIKRLEKQLKINKKKNKISSFASDGLDYLLEACDLENISNLREPDLSDDSDNFDEDLAVVMREKEPETCEKDVSPSIFDVGRKRVQFDVPESENTSINDDFEGETDSFEVDEKLRESSDETDEEVKKVVDRSSVVRSNEGAGESESSKRQKGSKRKKKKLKEDIYGRLRDEEGNVVTREKEAETRYLPPALREKSDRDDIRKAEMLLRLRRQLKGLLNRLSESNLNTICNEIEKLYMSNARNDMNETLIKLVFEAVVQTAVTPERMVQEYAVLVALLHANIGSEIGAQFLESVAKKMDSCVKSGGNYGDGKECDNLLLFLVHLYSFKIIHSSLIYDVLKILSNSFNEKDVDLILLILRSAGFSLRKDDPLALKQTISSLQMKATNAEHGNDQTRVRFMLDTLMAIRNNNMSKIPNYDTSHTEHLRKILRNLIRKGNSLVELNVSLADLMNAETKGRWWIVGSAWKDEDSTMETLKDDASSSQKIDNVSAEILEIAHKQRINTDTRKNIFCILMTAEDYIDAFEKLMHLGLTNQQERNIVYVVIDCCLQEKSFNRFYSYLLAKFCDFNRKYQITVQYAVWDRIKELSKVSTLQLSNLARLLSFLFLSKALPISVLKVIQFAEMDKFVVSFLRQIMLEILLHDSEEECRDVFTKVSTLPKFHLLREGLRLFIDMFLMKSKNTLSDDVAKKFHSRIAMVKLVLSGDETTTKL